VRAVGQVAAALRVGASPSAAWGDLGVRCEDGVPRAEDLRALGGAALGGAARVGASRDGAAPVIAAIRAAARVAARAGAPPAVLLDGAGAALEAQAELADRRRAALAGPAASARLLGWLPGVGLLLGLAVGADPLAILLDGGMGTALLCAGVVAALSGRAWTRGLVRAAADAGCEGHAAHGEHDARRGRPDTSGAARSLGPTRSARVRALARPAGSVAAAEVPAGVVLELVAASCAAGASVPGALELVGSAVAGARGSVLVEAAALLRLGAGWSEAWGTAPESVRPLADALRPAWETGVPPVGLLRSAAREAQRVQVAAATQAAGRLGVRLLLPLALCHLPAFVLVGLVPVLASLARSAVAGA
jgi:tight adherence protein B